jgi:hypothetical protein
LWCCTNIPKSENLWNLKYFCSPAFHKSTQLVIWLKCPHLGVWPCADCPLF